MKSILILAASLLAILGLVHSAAVDPETTPNQVPAPENPDADLKPDSTFGLAWALASWPYGGWYGGFRGGFGWGGPYGGFGGPYGYGGGWGYY